MAQAQDQHQAAVELFNKSLATFRSLGASWFVARALTEMGISLLAIGNEAEARRVWLESLSIATDIHAIPFALEALAGFASLRANQGHIENAFILLCLVLEHPASLQATKNRATALQVELEARLTPTEIEAIRIHVKGKTFEGVVNGLLT